MRHVTPRTESPLRLRYDDEHEIQPLSRQRRHCRTLICYVTTAMALAIHIGYTLLPLGNLRIDNIIGHYINMMMS